MRTKNTKENKILKHKIFNFPVDITSTEKFTKFPYLTDIFDDAPFPILSSSLPWLAITLFEEL